MRVLELKRQGIHPKIVIIWVGEDPASKLYTSLKKQAAERIGITLQLVKLKTTKVSDVIQSIKEANKDKTVQGVMVQMPLPEEFGSEKSREKIIEAIDPKKDVDGLRNKGSYKSATLMSVLYAIRHAQEKGMLPFKLKGLTSCVVGARGTVGRSIIKELQLSGSQILKCDVETSDVRSKTKKADLLISATGVPGLITAETIKPKAVVIDIGAPKGDVAKEVYEVASFITPVPGGIGPLTVVCLLENTVLAAEKLTTKG